MKNIVKYIVNLCEIREINIFEIFVCSFKIVPFHFSLIRSQQTRIIMCYIKKKKKKNVCLSSRWPNNFILSVRLVSFYSFSFINFKFNSLRGENVSIISMTVSQAEFTSKFDKTVRENRPIEQIVQQNYISDKFENKNTILKHQRRARE